MVENISSVYFNDWKSIFTIFVNGSRPLKFSAWFKKKEKKTPREKDESLFLF